MTEVFHPENDSQVAELVRSGLANGSGYTISGQNSKAGFGYTNDATAVISMSGFNGIVEYDPAELVMRAGAGTALADIEATLARQKQYLAFEPPDLGRLYAATKGRGSIGGTFLANLSGCRRFVAGAARDHILGVKAISGHGEVYKSGGNVIKNVTGYDLSKLLTGSWGTLSIVTELSFKVLPAPADSMTVAIAGLETKAALDLLGRIAGSPLQASGLAFVPAATLRDWDNVLLSQEQGVTLVRLEGSSLSIRERRRALTALLVDVPDPRDYENAESRHLWRAVADMDMINTGTCDHSIVKLSIAPSQAGPVADLLSSMQGCRWYLDAAGAWVHMALANENAVEHLQKIRQFLGPGGGSAVLYRAPEHIKRAARVFSTLDPGLMALTRRLKDSFDPAHILNPGRLFLDP